jgi:hypothetical protein
VKSTYYTNLDPQVIAYYEKLWDRIKSGS